MHGFSSHFAFGSFVFQCAQHAQETLKTSRAVRAFKKTFRTHSTLETHNAFMTPEAPDAFKAQFSFLKCPEVGSCFFTFRSVLGNDVLVVVHLLPLRVDVVRASGCRSKFRSRGPPGNVPFRASPGRLRKRPKWIRKPIRNDRSVNRNSHRIGPPPGPENLASRRRILERRNVAVAHTP